MPIMGKILPNPPNSTFNAQCSIGEVFFEVKWLNVTSTEVIGITIVEFFLHLGGFEKCLFLLPTVCLFWEFQPNLSFPFEVWCACSACGASPHDIYHVVRCNATAGNRFSSGINAMVRTGCPCMCMLKTVFCGYLFIQKFQQQRRFPTGLCVATSRARDQSVQASFLRSQKTH